MCGKAVEVHASSIAGLDWDDVCLCWRDGFMLCHALGTPVQECLASGHGCFMHMGVFYRHIYMHTCKYPSTIVRSSTTQCADL
jgi:hypothetical protein